MKELKEGCAYQLETGDIPQAKVFAHPLPFNVIPHIDKFQDNGYTKEVRHMFHIFSYIYLFL